jgi:hypothetical protein
LRILPKGGKNIGREKLLIEQILKEMYIGGGRCWDRTGDLRPATAGAAL